VQPKAQLEFELKSPLSPFSKGDFSVQDFKPLFGKEGKGRFLAERRTNYVANF
jgi:hypothetical protein